MAQTIDEIYNELVAEKANHAELDTLDSTSNTAIYRLIFYVVAVVMWSKQKLYDLHTQEVDDIIATKKPHGLRWYRDQALLFEYGKDLDPETGDYDNTGLTDTEIELSRIVKYSAVTEIDGKVRIKTATDTGGELAQLDADQLTAFADYMFRKKDAGVKIICDSLPADSLKLQIDIWFNPLVLRADGSRIDGSSNTPVPDAINAFLRTLPFNGEYANTRLTDYLQSVTGVVLVNIRIAQAKYGLFAFTSIDEKYIPDAGYLRVLPEDLTINYRENVQY